MEEPSEERPRGRNFIRSIIDEDLAAGRYAQGTVTRFPPHPNGYMHIGHCKSICLNFGLAADYPNGRCHLRFDDTNPEKEDPEYVEAIKRDVQWLGFDWGEHLYFASDYFEKKYELAMDLVRRGLAYVDSLNAEQMREYRGSLTEPARPSPFRDRSVAENVDLFERMRAGEFKEGEHVLRAKIDLTSPNFLMRDPVMYRIRHANHHRTGDKWCIYPMYDFSHCIGDSIEKVTHSICTLEFENNRELYDWFVANTGWERPPHQYEMARLALEYTITSKRSLLQLVSEGHVSGWDDPRMPTIAGMRRRGYTPEALRAFCEMIGVAKTNSMVDMGKLEFAIRDDLNHRAPRVMAVLRPLKVVITNYPEGEGELLEASYWPSDVPREGSRQVPFTREIFIEREDFAQEPPKGFRRMAPGRNIRLRYAYMVRCDDVVVDEHGEVTEVHCTYDERSVGTDEGRTQKADGVIHWVSASRSRPAQVRVYDRLFAAARPGDTTGNILDDLNPDSLEVLPHARVEWSVDGLSGGEHFQFTRQGYFVADPIDAAEGELVFNRVVTLRDSWSKKRNNPPARVPRESAAKSEKAAKRERPTKRTKAEIRRATREQDELLMERFSRYQQELELSEIDADLLTGTAEIGDFFEAALGAEAKPSAVAKWMVNDVARKAGEAGLSSLPFSGEALGALVCMQQDGTLSSTAAKSVFETMCVDGGSPSMIATSLGLDKPQDDSELRAWVAEVISDNPDEVARYRGGQTQLVGFFMGQVMRKARGKADPDSARAAVLAALAAG